MTKKELGTGVI